MAEAQVRIAPGVMRTPTWCLTSNFEKGLAKVDGPPRNSPGFNVGAGGTLALGLAFFFGGGGAP